MTAVRRAALLLLSLLLPAITLASVVGITLAALRVGDNDRAIVWVAGTPAQLAAASLSLQANEWFADVGVDVARAALPAPPECPAHARQLSIGKLRQEEIQAARELIEAIAQDNGAWVCRSQVYLLNESRTGRPQAVSAALAGAVLESCLLPLGLVAWVFLAYAGRLGLRRHAPAPRGLVGHVAAGIGAGLVWWLAIFLLDASLRPFGLVLAPAEPWSASLLGPGLVIGIVLVEPLLGELSFRAWMLPLSERALGPWAAAIGSTVAFAAAQLPASPADAAPSLLLGAINAALYLKTRSLVACVLCSAMASASLFLPVWR